ncbi:MULTISPECIES: multidrug ABC transporter ATPase [Microbacterium]|uniref:multidrug ABC transporter ATPase n=1 Tax=Microbacterium TaxID=33882 RepID=UPI0012B8D538|nr:MULTISPECIES: multidrug ABC transporter ATPase [Microbacterium]MTE23414.1 multidrug ABC transporter ATPase [Microbacterium sp. ZXX196]NHI17873.1 multidrug ABC transporter ATPase [Microbacterium excoecariae]
MSNNADGAPPVRRIDRVLAAMSLGILVLSIGCFVAVMIAGAVGGVDYASGVWPTVFVVQMVGPVISFLLLLALLIMSFIRRGRANRQ